MTRPRTAARPLLQSGRTALARAASTVRLAGRQRALGAAALAAGLVVSGYGAVSLSGPEPVAATSRVADIGDLPATVHGTPGSPSPAAEPPSPAAPAAPPVRLRIDRIGVDTPLSDLQVQDDGHLAAPGDPNVAGWWSQGPTPGSPGTAVIVGHVDSRTGPAVFVGLSSLRPGDTMQIDAADGTTTHFTVQALRNYGKQDFPAEQVFGDTPGPSLRLITCGGLYDRQHHAYPENLVVFAAPPTPTPSAAAPSPA